MKLGKLGQFTLPIADADRSEAFYSETLGLNKLFRFDNLVFFDCAGVRLMLEGNQSQIITSDICHYFSVSDIDSCVEVLESRGVAFTQQPHLIAEMPDHHLWMAFFKDPDGHTLALMEERANNTN